MLIYLLLPYVSYFGLYDAYYNTDDKLKGCSDLQKFVVSWLSKSILIITYFLNKFHFRWIVSDVTMLKFGAMGIALTTVWIHCLKNYPIVIIPLMLLHAFCLVIGPLHSIEMFFRKTLPAIRSNDRIILFIMHWNTFFMMFGHGILFHFFGESAPPVRDGASSIESFIHSMRYILVAETPIEFARVQSVLAVILLGMTLFMEWLNENNFRGGDDDDDDELIVIAI